jgi:hypothetical protein
MESDTDKGGDWLDFKDIKARAHVRPVLEYFGILEHLEARGAELVGWCPLGKEHGKADSFAFNVEKRSFQCFACKARGSVLDFIGKYQGVGLREAAKIALEILGEKPAATPQEERREGKGRPYGKPSSQAQLVPSQKTASWSGLETPGLPAFTWSHAQFLIEAGQLDPDRLVVLNVDSLEAFLRLRDVTFAATKKSET